VGGARYIKDTYVAPQNLPQSTPIEEVEEKTNPTENELQRTQVEQTEISSGSGIYETATLDLAKEINKILPESLGYKEFAKAVANFKGRIRFSKL
jgi:hypothetical protein